MAEDDRGSRWYSQYKQILEGVMDDAVKTRQDAVLKLRTFISLKRNIELLEQYEEHSWITTLHAIFHVTSRERNASYTAKERAKPTLALAKRLEDSTSLLRYLVEKIHKRLPKKAVKAVVTHVVDMVVKDNKLQPFILTYLRILRTLLNYPPHLDHLEPSRWLDITTLCFSGALGDPIKIGREFVEEFIMDIEVGDGIVGGLHGRDVSGVLNESDEDELEERIVIIKTTATQEDIEFLSVLEVLFRSTAAPFPHHSRIILAKFIRFFRRFTTETTAHFPALTALNHALADLELNDRVAMQSFAPHLWTHVLSFWNTKSPGMKEQVIMASKYLLPFINGSQEESQIKMLYTAILGEPEIRWRMESINIDFLRLGINTSESQEKRAFTLSTFKSGDGFSNVHAVSWTLLELGAASLAKLYRFSETPKAKPDNVPPTPEGINKRRKIEDPLATLVDSLLSAITIDESIFRLQILLFLAEEHWSTLHSSSTQRIIRTLMQLLAHEDAQIQCWSFFVVAAIAGSVSETGSGLGPMEWEQLWHISIRRIQNPLVCRLAAHTANVIFSTGRINSSLFLTTIESIGEDLDIQGPNFPSDSVCAFLDKALVIASNDVRLCRIGLPEKIFAWLTSAWKPLEGITRPHTISQVRPRADPFDAKDLSLLTMQICGLQQLPTLISDAIIPDGPISTMAIAAVETQSLRRFLLDAHIPPYSFDTPSPPPIVRNSQTASSGLQRRVSKWLEKMMDSLSADGDAEGDVYWTMVSVDKARRYFDLASTVLLVEGALKMNGIMVDMATINATSTFLTHLGPIINLKKWSPGERAIVLGGISNLLIDLPPHPPVQYPVLLDPGIASAIDQRLLPHRNEKITKVDFHSTEFKLLQSIWSIEPNKIILVKLVERLELLLTVATNGSNSTQATQTQQSQSQRGREMEQEMDDGFGEIRIAETAHLKALVKAERAADACMSIIVRGMVSGVMIVTQAAGSVRVPAIVEALVSSDGNAAISIAEHTFNAVLYGIMNFRVTEAEEVLEHLGGDLLPDYQFASDERFALAALLFLECTAEVWIGIEDGANEVVEALGTNARELCGWYSSKIERQLLPSWRVRLRFIAFLDTYLSIDQNQSRWTISDTDEPVIAPTAILPTLLKDPDFRVRFKASSSTAALFNFMERNGHPTSALFDDIRNHIHNDLAAVEIVITQIVCLANVMVTSGERRRSPYPFLHEIASSDTFIRQVEALFRGIAVRLGISDYRALHRNYSQWLAYKSASNNHPASRFSPKVCGYNSRLELVEDTFKQTGSVLLVFDSYDAFKSNCDVVHISVAEGILRCLPETIALAVFEFWKRNRNDKDVNTDILVNRIDSLVTNALGEDHDAYKVKKLVKSVSDQVLASMLSLTHEDIYPALEKHPSITDPKVADTFQSILKLETDLLLTEAPPPHVSLKLFDQAYIWLSKAQLGFSSVDVLYSVIQQLFYQIHRSIFLDDQRRLLVSVGLALGYGRRLLNNTAFLGSLATSLIRLLPNIDLVPLTTSILQWCLDTWNGIEKKLDGEKKFNESGTDLCKNLLYVAQAALNIAKDAKNEEMKALGESLYSSMNQLIRSDWTQRSPEFRDIALLWPRALTKGLESDQLPISLASPFLSKEKFRLIRLMALDKNVKLDGSTLWRLFESIPPTGLSSSQQSLDLANLIYRGNGRINRPAIDEAITPVTNRIDLQSQVADNDIALRAIISAKIFNLLDDIDPVLAHMASKTLRSIYTLQALDSAAMKPLLSTQAQGSAQFLSTQDLLKPHQVRIRSQRNVTELKGGDWIRAGEDYGTWIRQLSRLLADSAADGDEFYAQLDGLLDISISFTADVLPNLVHSILLKAIETKSSTQQVLSDYFIALLKSSKTDPLCVHSIVDLVIALRRQTKNSKTPLSCDQWLSIPWISLSSAALRSQSHFAAALFLELAHEYDGLLPKSDQNRNDELESKAVQIHYELYAALDEPDGFYGLQSSDVRDALVKRYHHESRWNDAFRVHGADYESTNKDESVSLGVMESLSSFGFNRLAMSILQPTRNGKTPDRFPPELPYRLAVQTSTWDLPIEPRAAKTSSVSLYSALRAVHTSRDTTSLVSVIDTSLATEVFKLSAVSIELPIPNPQALSTVLSLREVREWTRIDTAQEIDPKVLEAMVEIPSLLSFEHSQAILTTRISLLRSIRVRESADQIGEGISALGDQVTKAERACLLRLSTVARDRGFIQVAMNSITAAQGLVESGKRDLGVEEEFANVLWSQGEHSTAISVLHATFPQHSKRPATVSARLGEWSMQTKVKDTRTILEDYFGPATEALNNATPIERTQVHNAFAVFADIQYQKSLVETGEQRKRKELFIQMISAAEKAERAHDEAGSMDDTLRSQFEKAKANSAAAAEENRLSLLEAEETTEILLTRALENYGEALLASDKHDSSILRFCALWLAHATDEKLNRDTVARFTNSIPSSKFVFVAHQLSARLDKPATPTSFSKSIFQLVTAICRDHPFHCLYQVSALRKGNVAVVPKAKSSSSSRRSSSQLEEPRTPRAIAANEVFEKVKKSAHLTKRVEALEMACNAYIEWANWDLKSNPAFFVKAVDPKRSGGSWQKNLKIPGNALILSLIRNLPIPPPTLDLPIDLSCRYDQVPTLIGYENSFSVPGGVNFPTIVKCRTTDGKIHTELLKGRDDSRQDAVMEQAFVLMNGLLQRDEASRSRNLRIRTYKVIPLAHQTGIIEFVDNTKSLSEILLPSYAKFCPKGSFTPAEARKELTAAQHLKKAESKIVVFNSILKKLPPILRHYFFQNHKVPSMWFDQRLNYSRSVATNAIVGYVLGLGDRHVSNILMDFKSGELVMIDLGIAFDQGRRLPVPELVPFRLTQNIVDGLGMNGVNGVFRRCAEETLRVLREGSSQVLTVLEVFKHDPLQSWALSVDLAQRIQGSSIKDGEGSSKIALELPDDADRALGIVTEKLSVKVSCEHAVNELIASATDLRNLSHIYHGWQPYL